MEGVDWNGAIGVFDMPVTTTTSRLTTLIGLPTLHPDAVGAYINGLFVPRAVYDAHRRGELSNDPALRFRAALQGCE